MIIEYFFASVVAVHRTAVGKLLHFFLFSETTGSIDVCLMVFNATFNNISVISWQLILLVEETGVPGENHQPVVSHWHILSHNVVHLVLIEIRTHISGDGHWLHRFSQLPWRSRPRRLPGLIEIEFGRNVYEMVRYNVSQNMVHVVGFTTTYAINTYHH